jgi:hypothetical protein
MVACQQGKRRGRRQGIVSLRAFRAFHRKAPGYNEGHRRGRTRRDRGFLILGVFPIMPLTIQAMSGVAYISSYGTYYFELAGISTQKSFQIQCGAQALSIAGNIGAFLIIDRIGRRPLLLWAFGFLTVLLCVTGGLGTMTTNPSAVLGKCTGIPTFLTQTN